MLRRQSFGRELLTQPVRAVVQHAAPLEFIEEAHDLSATTVTVDADQSPRRAEDAHAVSGLGRRRRHRRTMDMPMNGMPSGSRATIPSRACRRR